MIGSWNGSETVLWMFTAWCGKRADEEGTAEAASNFRRILSKASNAIGAVRHEKCLQKEVDVDM